MNIIRHHLNPIFRAMKEDKAYIDPVSAHTSYTACTHKICEANTVYIIYIIYIIVRNMRSSHEKEPSPPHLHSLPGREPAGAPWALRPRHRVGRPQRDLHGGPRHLWPRQGRPLRPAPSAASASLRAQEPGGSASDQGPGPKDVTERSQVVSKKGMI